MPRFFKKLADDYRGLGKERDGSRLHSLNMCDPVFEYIKVNTGWTKTQMHEILKEDIDDPAPVYTAAAEPIGFARSSHASLIDATSSDPVVSFAANGDGSAGTNFIFHDRPFFVTRDRTVLRISDSMIDPEFILYSLRDMKLKHGFDHTHKAVPKNLGIVAIDIPITESGEWDLETQKRLANRHRRILDLLGALKEKAELVKTYDVEIQ